MRTVHVEASGSYDVLIGAGLLEKTGELVKKLLPKAERAVIVSDKTVDALYGEAAEKALGLPAYRCVLPPGEASKTGENYLKILNYMAEKRLTRSDLLLALGGGMTGDMAGFAAATYLRGIQAIQVPTTLLAAVDSSVGGKTAIDLDAGKNLAGAFCQPALVLCDTDTLDSLPEELFRDGCAEVVKYGVLGSPSLFRHLEEKGLALDREEVIGQCVAMKRDYVQADEFDTGLRRKLNLGHTLGHAVEAASAFSLSHGQAVAVGLAAVARASLRAGRCPAEDAERIVRLLEKLGLPTQTELDFDTLFSYMLSDKKRQGGTVNVIVPEEIGRCSVRPMNIEEVRRFFAG